MATNAAAAAGSRLRLRHASPVLLVGVVLAFALPFATASCDDLNGERHELRLTGLQLATYSVPPAHIFRIEAGGKTRETGKTDTSASADAEETGSAVALTVLIVVLLGVLFGAWDISGGALRTAVRGGFIATLVAAGGLGYLWHQARSTSDAHLEVGFWAAASLLAATLVVHGNTWRAGGGRARELVLDRFAGSIAIAIAWALSVWWLGDSVEIDLGLGGSGDLFVAGLAFGALAGVAAPARPLWRVLLAAAAPVVISLGDLPLVLPLLTILAAGVVRGVERWVRAWTADEAGGSTATAAMVAIAWTFSIWGFLVVELDAELDNGLDTRWSALIFAGAAVVGVVAGFAAPVRPNGRFLAAAAAPAAVFLSATPYLLPFCALALAAAVRVAGRVRGHPATEMQAWAVKGRVRGHPATETQAGAVTRRVRGRTAPETQAGAEPTVGGDPSFALRVPRTQVVMIGAVAGYLLGPAIIYADRLFWSPTTVKFAKNGPFQLWTAIIGAQTLVWAIALPPLLSSLRHRLADRQRPSLRREVIPSATILVLLVVVIVAAPAASDPFPNVIPHMHLKVRLVTFGALLMALLASTSIWLLRGRVERLAAELPTRETLAFYCRLRRELDMLLLFLGSVVGLAVLGTAELRKILLLYHEQLPRNSFEFPPEAVLLYGLILSFVLALVYIPTHAAFHRVGAGLRDAVAPFPQPGQLEDGMQKRERLDALLGLRLTASTSFRIAAALLSPLIGSLVSVLPKLSG